MTVFTSIHFEVLQKKYIPIFDFLSVQYQITTKERVNLTTEKQDLAWSRFSQLRQPVTHGALQVPA